MFSKKATKIDEISTLNFIFMLHNFKYKMEISLLFVAFLENMNFWKCSNVYLLINQNCI